MLRCARRAPRSRAQVPGVRAVGVVDVGSLTVTEGIRFNSGEKITDVWEASALCEGLHLC